MTEIFFLMSPILLIVLTGYLSATFSILNQTSNEHFTRLAFYIAIPCQVFYIFSKTPISEIINLSYLSAYIVCVSVTGAIIFLISKFILKKSLSEASLNIMGSSMTNTAYFAIPLFILIFKTPAPVISILFFQLMIMTTVILVAIEHDTKTNYTHNFFVLSLQNPIILAAFLGFIFSCLQLSIPTFLSNYLNLMGSAAVPLVLFSLGISLYFDFKKITHNAWIEISLLTFTKIIALPLLAFYVGKYIFGLNAFWLTSLIMMAAMPTPNNMFIFAMKYNLDVKKASTVVSTTTLLSFFTLSFIYLFCHTGV